MLGRRDLFKLGAAALAGLAGRPSLVSAARPRLDPAIPARNLGRTGYSVGIFSLGGQAALEKPDNADSAVPLIERALDLGVNYIDTSARYGGPARWSESYIGRVMKLRRAQAFLGANTTTARARRLAPTVPEQWSRSFRPDHLDLWAAAQPAEETTRWTSIRQGRRSTPSVEAREQRLRRDTWA